MLREDRADRLASNYACLFSIRSPSGPAATPLTAELRTGSGKGVSQLLRKVGYGQDEFAGRDPIMTRT